MNSEIIHLNRTSGSKAIGSGRELGVNVSQIESLSTNYTTARKAAISVQTQSIPQTPGIEEKAPVQTFEKVPDVGTPEENIAKEFTGTISNGVSQEVANQEQTQMVMPQPEPTSIPVVENQIQEQPPLPNNPSVIDINPIGASIQPEISPGIVEEKPITENNNSVIDIASLMPAAPEAPKTLEENNIQPQMVEMQQIPDMPVEMTNSSQDIIKEEPKGVEIVSTKEPETDNKIVILEKYLAKRKEIENKYQQELNSLDNELKVELQKAFDDDKKKIINMQEKARDHLDNAQAAEQIAMIAKANAERMQKEMGENPQILQRAV